MSKPHAEIAGAGFAGLVAAIALAERGWSVRIYEKSPRLRAEGFAISTQPNTLKVLEAIGVRDRVLQGGLKILRRETRDQYDRPTMVAADGGGHRISRQHIVTTLEDRARQLGVDVEFGSQIASAHGEGVLVTSTGRRLAADIVIAADGVHSRIRESLGIPAAVTNHADGAMRLMVSRTVKEAEEDVRTGPMTCERWSGTRRILTSPCSSEELYVALSCLVHDELAKRIPLDQATWSGSFPYLADSFKRIGAETDWSTVRWVQFQTVKLQRWSLGRVAIVGDAAHAMPPNLAQGAGCAMMNALSLAVSLANNPLDDALRDWEARERPLTEHTQRWSRIYGSLTVWPEWLRSNAFTAMGKIKWIRRRYQRTANHIPTGYQPQTQATAMPIRTDRIPPNPHLAVDIVGSGELVLFLHGIGGNRSNWTEQLAATGAEFLACAWDARGYGDSEDYEGPLRFVDFRNDVVRVLDHFSARAVHLVGLSMGGLIAQDFYRHEPSRVLSLTLADTRNALQRFNNEEFLRRREAPLLAGKSPRDIAPGLAPTLASPHAETRVIRRLEDSISALHKESYLKTLRAVTLCGDDPEFRGVSGFVELGSISVPTLVICGADDTVTPPDISRSMAREIPNARLHIIPGAGHLTNIEKAVEFNAILLDFLREASAFTRP